MSSGWVSSRVRELAVLTWRNLIHIAREPMQLSDVTIFPVLFTLLFIYVFGAGIHVLGGYRNYVLAGMVAVNLTTTAGGTAVGLATDMSTGVIDRFRTLPMSRASVLAGRSVTDLLTSALGVAIVAVTGLAIGWRPHAGPASILAAFAVVLAFGYGLIWLNACFGLAGKSPESAQSLGLMIMFPVAFLSNAFVPTQGMAPVLRTLADWNPVSAVTSASRSLLGNPNPASTIHTWPMQHPVLASLAWSTAMVAICAPLAARQFRRRTTG